MKFKGSTMQKIIEYWALNQPDKKAFVHISDDKTISASFKEIFLKSLAISNELKSCEQKSKCACAIVMYPAGIDFIIAFFSCILSGTIAVPVNMPKGNRSNEKILKIIDDCKAKIVLSTNAGVELFKNGKDFKELPEGLRFIETESYLTSSCSEDTIKYTITGNENEIAFLQYTSGSTSFPKGVEIRHTNLLYNLYMMQKAFEVTNDSIIGTWLPHFHDMGLIACMLNAFYNGATCVIMAPLMFLKNPVSWFKMITDYKVTLSGGPSFAYDYCVDKIQPEQLTGINLSSWDIALNGAEPVFYDTMVNFSKKFKQVGFSFKSFYPAYGMAEATVFVSGNKKAEIPKVIYVDYNELSKNTVKKITSNKPERNSAGFVCCGEAWLEEEIWVVDSETKQKLKEDKIGEICISGQNVTYGYWGKEKDNKERFFVAGDGGEEKKFYRTGDLGFYSNGGLYITGRKDDVMIINGVNIYPQDIERVVENALQDEARLGTACAFEVSNVNDREIVVLVEVYRSTARRFHSDEVYFKKIVGTILENISEEFDFQIKRLVFLTPGSVYKTSSGKLCRKENRKKYLQGELPITREWKWGSDAEQRTEVNSLINIFERVNSEGFIQFKIFSSIIKILSSEGNLNVMELDVNKSLFFYGINSLKIFDIHLALEKEYDVKIPTEIFFDSGDLITVLNRIAGVLERKNIHDVERTSVKLIDEIKKYEEIVTKKLTEVSCEERPLMSYDRLQNVLLTGGAGFVGGFILKEILLKTKADIYCLVRAKSSQHGIERISNNLINYDIKLTEFEKSRIKIIIGDISVNNLGFDSVFYDDLADKIDLVIHCAAMDNFYLPYSALKAPNVDGVKNIMLFSLHKKVKPMLYTASCSSTLIDGEMNSDKLIGIINGYSQTKYVAQELLLKLIQKGFPGVSIKLGYLYANEAQVAHPEDGFESLISSIYNIGAVPIMDADFDLTSVEYVAEVMTDMALNYPMDIKAHYILYNPKPLKWGDVIKAFKRMKPEIKEVPLDEFVEMFQKYVHSSKIPSLKFVSRIITNRLERQFNKMFRAVEFDLYDKYIHLCPPCEEQFADFYIDIVMRHTLAKKNDNQRVL